LVTETRALVSHSESSERALALAIFSGPTPRQEKIMSVPRWSRSTPGYKRRPAGDAKYLEIILRKFGNDKNAFSHYLLCCANHICSDIDLCKLFKGTYYQKRVNWLSVTWHHHNLQSLSVSFRFCQFTLKKQQKRQKLVHILIK